MRPFVGFAPTGPMWRRSWVANNTGEYRAACTFYQILAKLDPRAARRVSVRDGRRCYQLVCESVAQSFPIWENEYFDDEASDVSTEELLELGIPVQVFGFSRQENRSEAMALVQLNWDAFGEGDDDESLLDSYEEIFGDDTRWMESWWVRPEQVFTKRPPKGRQWLGKWAAVNDLCEYVVGDTNFGLLNYSNEEFWEMGVINPPWDMDEINAITETWKLASKLLERINALARWIDEAPRQRLPLLDGVMRGDGAAIMKATRPVKANDGKTLAQVFLAEEKRKAKHGKKEN